MYRFLLVLVLDLRQVETTIVFQCTFILTFYHGAPKIPQEFWHRWDFSSDILDATAGISLPPPSCSSLLHSCCLSARGSVLVMLAPPQQHPVSNAKDKERESWWALPITHPPRACTLQTHGNWNRWQHKDKVSWFCAAPGFTDSTAQSGVPKVCTHLNFRVTAKPSVSTQALGWFSLGSQCHTSWISAQFLHCSSL